MPVMSWHTRPSGMPRVARLSMIWRVPSTMKVSTTGRQMILNQDNEYAAVLDACVLVPMPLCDTLLRLAEDPGMYRPLWSEAILAEVGTALGRNLGLTPQQIERRLRSMRDAFPESSIPIPTQLPRALDGIPDPGDR